MAKAVFIAGPTSKSKGYSASNLIRAKERFEHAGWIVLNPKEIGASEQLGDNQRRIFQLLLCADTLAVIPGWWESQQAMLVMSIAKVLNLEIVNAATLKPFEEPVFIDFCHNSFRWSGEVV